jgi:hypothetical protein
MLRSRATDPKRTHPVDFHQGPYAADVLSDMAHALTLFAIPVAHVPTPAPVRVVDVRLERAFRDWKGCPDWLRGDRFSELCWAANARMVSDLPPPGPDAVEVEVACMFESHQTDAASAFASTECVR